METQVVEDQPCVILEDDEDTCNLSPKSEPRSPAPAKMDPQDSAQASNRGEEQAAAREEELSRFRCPDCDFRSDSSHQLEKHIRTHTGMSSGVTR